ncbi:MAG: S8 family serine peptidase, partial [Planctomycetota bacterium]
TNSGATFVASAGNGDFLGNGIDLDGPVLTTPAQFDIPGIISVAATTPADTLAFYSNFGETTVDVAAPASATLTTDPNGGYRLFNGTSAAAPIVSGIVGLLKTVRPELTPVEIKQILIDSSDFVPALADKVVADGRVNALRALEVAGVSGPIVRRATPGPITGQTLDDGSPVNSVVVEFSKALDPAFFDTASVSFVSAGNDEVFDTGDDVAGTVTSVAFEGDSERAVRVGLDTSNADLFAGQRLREGSYRVTLGPDGFRDTAGNRLNGTAASGLAESFSFDVVTVGDPFEANDTLGLAVPVSFDQGGVASFERLAVGDGIQGALDVDLFVIDVPAAGLITAEVVAQRQALPSALDAQLRLFDINGNEIASNDQFFGADPFINFFVATDGVYYLGVSGFGNSAYDPELSGSGAEQSIGGYDLEIGLELAGPESVVRERDLAANPPVAPVLGELRDTITFTDARVIRDLNVTLDLEHGRVGDVRVSLISPAGTEVVLVDQRGAGGDGFDNTRLDDEAGTPIVDADAPFTGSFKPENALGAFAGESGSGDWVLVIEDLIDGVGGRLLGWSLEFEMESQITGPFELNDTIASAANITQIDGAGVATLEANIGDGPFGLRDRDIYRFNATSGSTLSAFVQPGEESGLDASLRLFDDIGREIVVSSPATGRDAAIDRFVIVNGGTYYLAVAEQNNTRYDPFNALSGEQGLTSGDYTLGVTVIAGLSDVPGVINGGEITLGVGGNGEITRLSNSVANSFVDYLGFSPDTFFGASADGAGFINGVGTSSINLPMSVVNESDARNSRLVTKGSFRGLDIRRTISFGDDDSFVVFDVALTNNSGQLLNDVVWVEGLDPEQGQSFSFFSGDQNTSETSNDLVEVDTDNDGIADTLIPLVTAGYTPEFFGVPFSIGLGAPTTG